MQQQMNKPVDMATMKLTHRHVRIMLVSALGQFLGQGLATLAGIVIPLMQLNAATHLSATMQGLLGCVSLIGIMIGTVVLGNLSDRYGYLLFFRLCPLVIALSALLIVVFPSIYMAVACLFVMGFAIGGEYSLDSDYISELMPVKWRIFMVGVAKALASAGSAVVAVICYVVLVERGDATQWSKLFYIVVAIAVLMFLLRVDFAQSPAWLVAHGQRAKARKALERLLGADVALPPASTTATPPAQIGIKQFIRENKAKTILTGVPWACEGLGVYGIGIFMPVLIMGLGLDVVSGNVSAVAHIENSVGLTFVLCVVMMAGFGVGLALLRRCNHLSMQTAGFVGSAAGLVLLLAAYCLHWPDAVAIAGFVVFELSLNAGPHLITFILPSKVYAVSERGTGAGIAACIGKSGAVLGAFVIPLMLKWGGVTLVMAVSAVVMAVGAAVTAGAGRRVNSKQ